MVVPGGSCLAREGQTNSGQGWLERSRKAPPLHRVSDTEHRTPEESGLWDPAGWLKATLSRAGPACTRPGSAYRLGLEVDALEHQVCDLDGAGGGLVEGQFDGVEGHASVA